MEKMMACVVWWHLLWTRLLLVRSHAVLEAPVDHLRIPKDRFPYIQSIGTPGNKHICSGALIREDLVLTSATCAHAVRSDPIVVLHRSGFVNASAAPLGVQVLPARVAYIHPKWRKTHMDGFDAALLSLPSGVAVATPVLADTAYCIDADVKLHGLKVLNNLEIIPITVKANNICKPENLCYKGRQAYSSVFTEDRDRGILMLLDSPKSPSNGEEKIGAGDPRMDLVIGISPFVNASSSQDGWTCAYVAVSSIRDWIEEAIVLQESSIGLWRVFRGITFVVLVLALFL